MTTSKTPILDELLKGLTGSTVAKADKPPAALAVLEAASDKIAEALKSVKAAGGLTMELAGELKGIGDGLIKLSTPQAPPAEGATEDGGGDEMAAEKTMTKAEFAAFLPGVMKAAQDEKDPEKKKKRLAYVAKILTVAKSNFETSETVKVPPIEEAFKGSGGGSSQDLTSVGDQSTTETKVGAGGAQGGGQFSANGTNQGAQPGPTGDPMMKLVPALLKELGIEPNPGGTKPTDDGGGRSHYAKNDDSFAWPRDMQRALHEEEVTKRTKREPDKDADWGRDPWAAQ
jgi:hypothetical protein